VTPIGFALLEGDRVGFFVGLLLVEGENAGLDEGLGCSTIVGSVDGPLVGISLVVVDEGTLVGSVDFTVGRIEGVMVEAK